MTRAAVAQTGECFDDDEQGTLLFPPLSLLSELLDIQNLSAAACPEQCIHDQWRDLLSAAFKNPAARHFWHDKLEKERALAQRIRQMLPETTERMRYFVRSPLARELGCPSTLNRLERLLERKLPEAALLEHPLVLQARLADTHALLIRLAAWKVVELSLEHWDILEQTGEQERVLLQHFLPSLDPQTGHWSPPLGNYLDHLAKLCGCSPDDSPDLCLAGRWQSALEEDAMPNGRQALLENWRAGLTRPAASDVSELLEAVLQTILQQEGEADASRVNIQLMEKSFRFAEGCGHLQNALNRHAIPDRVISGIFAVYRPEYQKARAILGRPLANKPRRGKRLQ